MALFGAAMTLAALVLVVLGDGPAAGRAPALELRSVGSFDQPTFVTYAPGSPGFLYVVEQSGAVRVVDHGVKRQSPFLNLSGRISCCGERGLLSLAFDPNFDTSRLVYASYTNDSGNIEVDEFHAPTATRVNPASRRTVIVIPHPNEGNHNGGQLQFGSGGNLYISTGDGGGGDDVHDNARKLDVLLGKILRIRPQKSASKPYTVPAGNPFVGRTGRDEIYSYGLRNPWRFSIDSANGNIVIGDVGQGAEEEIDYVTAAGASGTNFGWPQYEGDLVHDASRPGPGPPKFPIFTYPHSNGGCAIIGGYVVHSPALGPLNGRYVYSDNCNGDIRSLVARTTGASGDRSTGLSVSSPSSFGVGPSGQLYVASLGDGHVYRIAESP
jgi:glucose/arabinose dehydrogenase